MTKANAVPGLGLAVVSAVAILVALAMVFLYAPREATMGDVQRTFYFHVASAWVGFAVFFVTFLGSIGYLVRGERRWDVLALFYLAYGMLRASIEDPQRKARFAAVYGIAAFVTVPLSWFAIRWWRTIHPDILTGNGEMALTPRMVHTLLVSLAVFTLLYATLLWQRVRLEQVRERVSVIGDR